MNRRNFLEKWLSATGIAALCDSANDRGVDPVPDQILRASFATRPHRPVLDLYEMHRCGQPQQR